MDHLAALPDGWAYVVLFVLLALQEIGLPSPIPSDLFVIYAATFQEELGVHPIPLIGIATVATFLASTALYALGRYRAADLLDRHGKRLGLGEDSVRAARRWTGRNGAWAFFLARVIPGGRALSPLVAGCLHLSWKVFLPVNAAAILVRWAIAYVIGVVAGQRAVELARASGLPWWALVGVFAVIGAAVALHRWSRVRRQGPAGRTYRP